jgi:threonyl-tRNA synthetase
MSNSTPKPKISLDTFRHTTAHILATAVYEMFPDAQFGVGPTTDTGFYYDFWLPRTLIPEDLDILEQKMRDIIKANLSVEKADLDIDEAIEKFTQAKQDLKVELLSDLKTHGTTDFNEIYGGPQDTPTKRVSVNKVSVYKINGFVDLCRGPHIDSTGQIDPSSFKLDRISSVYFRGDAKNRSLQRVYGLMLGDKKALKQYIFAREEAKKRDHRKIGKELDLFTFSDLIGPGLPLFTPRGTAMRDAIVSKIFGIQRKYGYQAVTIPHITKNDLYKTSGHWEKFGDELFKVKGVDTEFVMKPMNCPHHTQIYASSPKSYRDLPVRYMENTMVYRDEQSGELLGLSRVRSITQDDGHVFCTPDQITQEVKIIIAVIKEFYTSLGMWSEGNFRVSLSARNPHQPEKYLGGDEIWEESESTLAKIAKDENLPYEKFEGEAAFYGPKLDFLFKDALGREWQLATVQLDFNMPQRFDLKYIDESGAERTPVMIHRAVAGSLERFMSVIIEHFAGHFPIWLAPEQVRILPISDKFASYAQEVLETLQIQDWRVTIDSNPDTLGKKIRNAQNWKVPVMLIVGEKEEANHQVSIRQQGIQENKLVDLDKLEDYLSNL